MTAAWETLGVEISVEWAVWVLGGTDRVVTGVASVCPYVAGADYADSNVYNTSPDMCGIARSADPDCGEWCVFGLRVDVNSVCSKCLSDKSGVGSCAGDPEIWVRLVSTEVRCWGSVLRVLRRVLLVLVWCRWLSRAF